jgi:hypothetical protein
VVLAVAVATAEGTTVGSAPGCDVGEDDGEATTVGETVTGGKGEAVTVGGVAVNVTAVGPDVGDSVGLDVG